MPQPLPEELPVVLRLAVEKALAKDPAERYQSMREMVTDLRRLVRATGEAPAISSRKLRRATWAAVIIAAGLAGWWGLNIQSRMTGPQIRSLAVLPLKNLSGDADQQYLADGMTEALTTSLAQISALSVISRTSALHYQGTGKTTPEIARELNVNGLVEGSVQRSGGRVQVTVQLIEGASDRHLWAKTYERDTKDALALQNQVAQAIAGEIRVKLTSQEQARLGSPRAVNPDAQEAYLRGRYWQDNGDVKKAHNYYEQAAQKDPSYAAAYAALGGSYGPLAYAGLIPGTEAYPKWRAGVTTALKLDDNLAEAHNSLAALLSFHDWNWRDSEREYRRALELNPNLADAHLWLSDVLLVTGRPEEAVAEARRGVQLNPNSIPESVRLGWTLLYAKRLDEAAEQGRKILELDTASGRWILGLTYEQKGDLQRAIGEFREALQLSVRDEQKSGWSAGFAHWTLAALAHACAISGRKAEALGLLERLKTLTRRPGVDAANFAVIYTGLGDKDQAFQWLDRGYNDRPSTMERVGVEPRLEPLHADPRFTEFLRKMGLPE